MSANETFDAYYAETAYTPEKRREWETAHPKRDKMFGSRLSWDRKTQDSGNEFLYDFKWLVTSQEFEERRGKKGLQGQHIFNELKARLDHQALMPPNYTALANVFIITISFAKFLAYFLPCITILSAVAFFIMAIFDGDFEQSFGATIYVSKIFLSLAILFLHSGKHWNISAKSTPMSPWVCAKAQSGKPTAKPA